MDMSVNGPQKQARTISECVWFEGPTALKEGQGVCYNSDYGVATAADARRYNRVELPSQANARSFAGVAAREYAAHAGGQLVEIFRPGSVCNILANANLTISSGLITCQAGGALAGYFTRAGFDGEGSAVPAQTVDRSATAGKCLALLCVGSPSGLIEVVTCAPAGGATVFLVGGVTYLAAVTLAADATNTLANGTISGMRKKFVVEGTQTTNNVVVTVTAGFQGLLNASALVALATLTMDTIGGASLLVWYEGAWQLMYNKTNVIA